MGSIAIECSQCASCCYDTITIITHHDIRRIAVLILKSPTEFVAMYSKRSVSIEPDSMGWIETSTGRRIMGLRQQNGRCLFLSQDGCCTIYSARPIVCQTYPFVAELDGRARIVGLGFHKKASHGGVVCTAMARLNKSTGTLAQNTQQEDREDRSYWRKVAQWNSSSKHKTPGAFLSYLGVLPSRRKGGM